MTYIVGYRIGNIKRYNEFNNLNEALVFVNCNKYKVDAYGIIIL